MFQLSFDYVFQEIGLQVVSLICMNVVIVFKDVLFILVLYVLFGD